MADHIIKDCITLLTDIKFLISSGNKPDIKQGDAIIQKLKVIKLLN